MTHAATTHVGLSRQRHDYSNATTTRTPTCKIIIEDKKLVSTVVRIYHRKTVENKENDRQLFWRQLFCKWEYGLNQARLELKLKPTRHEQIEDLFAQHACIIGMRGLDGCRNFLESFAVGVFFSGRCKKPRSNCRNGNSCAKAAHIDKNEEDPWSKKCWGSQIWPVQLRVRFDR
jgi:hypothetical protein